jgi:hypothetical protein
MSGAIRLLDGGTDADKETAGTYGERSPACDQRVPANQFDKDAPLTTRCLVQGCFFRSFLFRSPRKGEHGERMVASSLASRLLLAGAIGDIT